MNRRVLASLATFFFVGLTFLNFSADASLLDNLESKSGQDTFLPVEQAFPIFANAQPGSLTANWDNADGYYLYQHRIYLKQGDEKLSPVSWSKEGKHKYDEAFGDVVAYYGELSVTFDTSVLSPGEATLHYQGCADAGLCYPPQRLIIEIQPPLSGKQPEVQISKKKISAPPTENSQQQENLTISSAPPASPVTTGEDFFTGRSVFTIAGIFFLLGLGLTFTPCVLPMVPILTSVVLGQQKPSPTRGFVLSSAYVLGMAITYAAAGLTVGLLGAGANIQAWMQNPWILSSFALLFILLSLSMFGLYELQLPSSLRNRLNEMSQKQQGGHLVSVFFIGVLSALVVSPCVSAPLAGALAYLSTTGDAFTGGLALLALGMGMGTPLIILGTTGASVLPKAGMWMDRIKYLFGIMLIGVAIWLVSRVLPAALVLALWGALAIGAGISAGALNTVKGATQWTLKIIGLICFSYGVIAIAGAVNGHSNPLNPIGKTSKEAHQTPFIKTDSVAEVKELIANSDAPVMLDLYADWCISCKVMDKEIFAQADAQDALSHLLWVQLDVTENSAEQQALMKEADIFGPPTVLFFENKTGTLVGKIIGERHKEAFIAEALSIEKP